MPWSTFPMSEPSGLFSLPAGAPFIPTLIPWLLESFSPERLAQGIVFVPNQRGVSAMKTALEPFLRTPPLVLSLGHMHESAPLIARVQKHFPLPQQVAQNVFHDHMATQWFEEHPCDGTGVAILSHFAELFAQGIREEADWSRLDQMIPENLSLHRQQGLQSLEELLAIAQRIIATEGYPPNLYHRWFVDSLTKAWETEPPKGPLIFAGTTVSQLAIRRLIESLWGRDLATVILPGYPTGSPADGLSTCPPTHPTYVMEQLVSSLGKPPTPLPIPESYEARSLTIQQLQQHMFPLTYASQGKRREKQPLTLPNLKIYTAKSPTQEISMIAQWVREAVQEKRPSIAIVLNDRDMIEGLKATLEPEGILLSNPLGIPLRQTPLGHLGETLLTLPLENWALIPFLSLMKNRLCHPEIRELRETLEVFEKEQLRHFPLQNDIRPFMSRGSTNPLKALFERAQQAFGSFWSSQGKALPLGQWCHYHRQALLGVMDPALHDSQVFKVLTETWTLWSSLETKKLMTLEEYSHFFIHQGLKTTLEDREEHPMVHLMGPLEARLLHADRLIIPQFNEGIWPRTPTISPWLGERARQNLCFSPQEQRVGQSAHDFLRCLTAREVFITRSLHEGEGPTKPSPWLTRLQLALGPQWPQVNASFEGSSTGVAAAKRTSQPETFTPPQVPLKHKPLKFSATGLEKFLNNPYAYYASHILKLKPLEPFGYMMTPARYGQLLHRLMHRFIEQPRAHQSLESLLSMSKQLRINAALSPLQNHRFQKTLGLIFKQHVQDLKETTQFFGEIQGEIPLTVGDHSLRLHARADRLDHLPSGDLKVIDYKTGAIPSGKNIEGFTAIQLLLEALILEKGGFTPLSQAPCAQIEYRQMKIGAPTLHFTRLGQPALGLLLEAFEHTLQERLLDYLSEEFSFVFLTDKTLEKDPCWHLIRTGPLSPERIQP